MLSKKLLFVGSLGNPLSRNWIHGLATLGLKVAVLDWRESPVGPQQIANWGINEETPVAYFSKQIDLAQKTQIHEVLGGAPDILFGWWGSTVINPLRLAHQAFSSARVVLCVDTFPNAVHPMTEIREVLRLRQASAWIHGYIYYSHAMKIMYEKRIPRAKRAASLTMIEPYLLESFANDNLLPEEYRLEREDGQPYLIFTGRSDLLWSQDLRFRKDAVGELLTRITHYGIRVFVKPLHADLKGKSRLHHYPHFNHQEMFDGTFANYVSQFDGHLVLYNEFSDTIRRRVSTGLSTRLAFALTANCPIITSNRATFLKNEQMDGTPFAMFYDSPDDIPSLLQAKKPVEQLRINLKTRQQSFSFERQASRLSEFLNQV